jgi:hypothetical protein
MLSEESSKLQLNTERVLSLVGKSSKQESTTVQGDEENMEAEVPAD